MQILESTEIRRWRSRSSIATLVHSLSIITGLVALFALPWFGSTPLCRIAFTTNGLELLSDGPVLPALILCAALVVLAALPAIPAYALKRAVWLGNDGLYAISIAIFGVACASFWFMWDSGIRSAQNPGTFLFFFLSLLVAAISSDWTYSRITWGWGGQVANLVLHIGSAALMTFLWYMILIGASAFVPTLF